MLTPASWLPQAQRLAEGQRRRGTHDCGEGRVLIVEHQRDCWKAYCFRCNEHGWEPKPAESLSERIARRAQEQVQDETIASVPALPSPRNYDVSTWPEKAALWLYKASLGRPEIAKLGAYYHEPSARVVLPVYRNGAVAYWSARSVDGRTPKYLNSPTPRGDLVAAYGSGELLVLTEDILSAFRVGQVTEAWSLIGVHMNDAISARIVKRGGPVVVWLDPDWQYPVGRRPGVIAGRKILSNLQLMGVDARMVISRADPKLLSQREIRQCLSLPIASSPSSKETGTWVHRSNTQYSNVAGGDGKRSART